ncbi:hypothetical protein P256_01018 [Acinetobacter nectaris CIP 110549]|uniref:D-alanyl-D-alanine dipeptidase n=2 Tax=Acinetobacter nectaris TaxID=1219382 RepID=V2TD21_9GAMM|nr:hypothetical protein P256_01018 [Acinetobacter nectaris CIP 110549]
MYYKNIPMQKHINWDDMFKTRICASNEELINTEILKAHHIWTYPAYFYENIQGALSTCYVRLALIEKLVLVSQALPKGICLMILDGWRPVEVQKHLRENFYSEIQKKYNDLSAMEQHEMLDQFVALPSIDPLRPSPHLTGGSVDVTLCDEHGNILDMGTGFDEIHPLSFTNALEDRKDYNVACKNRRILYWAILSAGFSNLPSEWWHFDYGNQLWAYMTQQDSACYGVVSLDN